MSKEKLKTNCTSNQFLTSQCPFVARQRGQKAYVGKLAHGILVLVGLFSYSFELMIELIFAETRKVHDYVQNEHLIATQNDYVLWFEQEVVVVNEEFVFFHPGHAIRREQTIVLLHAHRLAFLATCTSIDWQLATLNRFEINF